MTRVALILALLFALASLASPATAGVTLEARVQAVTGIVRPQSAVLTALAQTRSAEIVGVLGHNIGSRLPTWWYGEVLGYNSGFADPEGAIVNGWRNSPGHWEVLSDPFYKQIGCGATYAAPRWYFVCIVGTQVQAKVAPVPVVPTLSPVEPSPAGIPNTAMSPH